MSTVYDSAVERLNWVAEAKPDAVRLARVASLAVRIEPHLLRVLRLELLPDADVSAEADLWFSELVESHGTDAIALDADVADVLRRDLARDRTLLARAAAMTRDAHAHLAPALKLEEEVNAAALLDGEAAMARIDEAMRAPLRAMVSHPDRAHEVAKWILGAWRRLHPVVRRSRNAGTLVLAASALLRRRTGAEALEVSASLADVSWALPAGAFTDFVEIGAQLVGDTMHFVAAAGADAMRVPRTDPPIVELTWKSAGEEQHRVVEASVGRMVRLGPDAADVHITTLAGEEYILGAAEGPTAPAVWVDISAYSEVAAACVKVMSDGEPRREATGFVVAPTVVVTTQEPFPNAQLLFRVGPTFGAPLQVVAKARGAIAIDVPDEEGLTPVKIPGPPFLGSDDVPGEGLKATAIGFVGETLRGVEGRVEISYPDGRDFDLFVDRVDLRPLPPEFVGGPVVIDRLVRGIVTNVTVPQQSSSVGLLTVSGAAVIHDLIALATERESYRFEAASQAARVRTPHDRRTTREVDPTTLPAWVREACVEVLLGENVPPSTGFAIGELLIVTSGDWFRNVPPVLIRRSGGWQHYASPLDSETSGPVILLRPLEAGRFEQFAPLRTTSTELPESAIVVTMSDGNLAAFEASFEASTEGSRESSPFEAPGFVLYVAPEQLPRPFRGAPVISGGEVVGIVTSVERDAQPSITLRVTPAAVIEREMGRLEGAKPDRSSPPIGLARVPADKFGAGFDSFTIRADLADSYRAAYRQVKALGGVLTSNGGVRDIGEGSTLGQSRTSVHYTGRAIDLFIYAGMQGGTAEPYLVTRDGGTDDNPKWKVYCVSAAPQLDDPLYDASLVEEGELECARWQSGVGYRTYRRRAHYFCLTDVLARHGWVPIPARSDWRTNYLACEWWHFQNDKGLVVDVSKFGDELRAVWPAERVGVSGLELDATWNGRTFRIERPATRRTATEEAPRRPRIELRVLRIRAPASPVRYFDDPAISHGPFVTTRGSHELRLPTAYNLATYLVTNEQFLEFVRDRGYFTPSLWSDGTGAAAESMVSQDGRTRAPATWPSADQVPDGKADHPVAGISYYEALAFTRWLQTVLPPADREWRWCLPSDDMWEFAARTESGQVYPWGNEFVPGRCNSRETGVGATTAVDRFPDGRSRDGCFDMAGNVWEFVDSSADPQGLCALRGGSYLNDKLEIRSSLRLHSVGRDHRPPDFGMRVAQVHESFLRREPTSPRRKTRPRPSSGGLR